MRFIPIGGCSEVGANSYFMEFGNRKLLLDAGLHPKKLGFDALPRLEALTQNQIDYILISHCHVDHCSSLPLIYRRFNTAKILMSVTSGYLIQTVLKNTLNVMIRQHYEDNIPEYPLFGNDDVDAVQKNITGCPYQMRYDLGEDLEGYFYDAAHILGSSGILLKSQGKSIFYTGDISYHGQGLLPEAMLPEETVDLLITECTLCADAEAEAKDRNEEITRLAQAITQILQQGGVVLLPVFALGRAQELLAVMDQLRQTGRIPKVPLYLSGLAKAILKIYDKTRTLSPRRDPNLVLSDIDFNVLEYNKLKSKPLLNSPGIFLLSAGMINKNTPSFLMAERILENPKNAIFFVGYIDPDSYGYKILNSSLGEEIVFDGHNRGVPRNCQLERFHFSAHANRQDLIQIARKLKPKRIIVIHGEQPAAHWYQQEISKVLPQTEVILPLEGQEYHFEEL